MIPCQCRHSISLTAIDPNMLDDGAIPKCILSYVTVFVYSYYTDGMKIMIEVIFVL